MQSLLPSLLRIHARYRLAICPPTWSPTSLNFRFPITVSLISRSKTSSSKPLSTCDDIPQHRPPTTSHLQPSWGKPAQTIRAATRRNNHVPKDVVPPHWGRQPHNQTWSPNFIWLSAKADLTVRALHTAPPSGPAPDMDKNPREAGGLYPYPVLARFFATGPAHRYENSRNQIKIRASLSRQKVVLLCEPTKCETSPRKHK